MAQSLGSATQKDFRDDLTVNTSPSFVSSDGDLNPVVVVGRGIERPNAKQAVLTYHMVKATADTQYAQVATASSAERVFFLGVGVLGLSTATYYIEDADSGNISPTDASTVALFYLSNPTNGSFVVFTPTQPRECKRGIRLRLVNAAATTSSMTVYYLIERIDGNLRSL